MFGYKLQPDEKLLKLYRKHKITLFPRLTQVAFLLAISLDLAARLDLLATQLVIYPYIVWTALVFGYGKHAFILWHLNKYLVTNKRLLHIVYRSIFDKQVIETPLDRILNVSYRTKGILSMLFYGDVLIQVVGVEEPLVLRNVPNPNAIKDYLWRVHLEYAPDLKLSYTKPEMVHEGANIHYSPLKKNG